VQEATQQMMAAIAALLPPDYRGDHDATVVGMGPERAQRDDAET
jgi:hypothetical protein